MAERTILVVDDDLRLHRLMQLILERAGYRVVTASTGEEGVEKVQAEPPDLVLMDVMMPGIDGFEATTKIRRLPVGRHLPIIFLSARDEADAKIRGLRGGGDDYVTKPVKAGELLARIEVQLREEAPALGQLVTVFGSRPGVGCTSVAVNLGLALRDVSDRDVLLVDWQRPIGDLGLFLGHGNSRALENILPQVEELDTRMFSKVMGQFNKVLQEYATGICFLAGAAEPATAKKMTNELLDQVLELALIKADYVILDGGTYFSWDKPPLVASPGGVNVCVLTPDPKSVDRAHIALRDVNLMEHSFWPLLNFWDASSDGRDTVSENLGTPLKGCLPDEGENADVALNEGIPLYLSAPESRFSEEMRETAVLVHRELQ